MKRNRAIFSVVILVFSGQALASEYREKVYLYLSPVPRIKYVLPQTRYFLVRFDTISSHDITNLSTLTRAASGSHPDLTKVTTDNSTVIFEVFSDFSSDKLITVTLTPTVDPCVSNVVKSHQYQFMVVGPVLFPSPHPINSGSPAHEEIMKPLCVRSLCLFPYVYNQFRKSV